jgi:hypothetical protein
LHDGYRQININQDLSYGQANTPTMRQLKYTASEMSYLLEIPIGWEPLCASVLLTWGIGRTVDLSEVVEARFLREEAFKPGVQTRPTVGWDTY